MVQGWLWLECWCLPDSCIEILAPGEDSLGQRSALLGGQRPQGSRIQRLRLSEQELQGTRERALPPHGASTQTAAPELQEVSLGGSKPPTGGTDPAARSDFPMATRMRR